MSGYQGDGGGVDGVNNGNTLYGDDLDNLSIAGDDLDHLIVGGRPGLNIWLKKMTRYDLLDPATSLSAGSVAPLGQILANLLLEGSTNGSLTSRSRGRRQEGLPKLVFSSIQRHGQWTAGFLLNSITGSWHDDLLGGSDPQPSSHRRHGSGSVGDSSDNVFTSGSHRGRERSDAGTPASAAGAVVATSLAVAANIGGQFDQPRQHVRHWLRLRLDLSPGVVKFDPR